MAWLWYGVLAADRLLRRVPSLIQVWLVEYFLVVPLAFFIGKLVDIRGAYGCPGTDETLDGTLWGCLGLSCVCGFFFMKNLIAPRFSAETWTPRVSTGLEVGDVELVVANRLATVTYPFLSSHPSYALLLLPTSWLPLMMIWATENQGCSTLYWKASGIAGLWIIAAMVVLRLICWYGLHCGQEALKEFAAEMRGVSVARLGWEMAWKPTLVLVTLMHLIVCVPIGIMFWQEHRTIAALPPVAVEMAEDAPPPHVFGSDTPRRWLRVEGRIIGDPVFWPATGENRGGNNYRGAAVLVALDAGGEALLLAESMGVGDLIGDIQEANATGRISSTGSLANGFSEDQVQYYGFTEDDFPPPREQGRVLLIHGYP